MVKTTKPQDRSARLATRVLVLANGAMRAFNELAAERELAQRAAAAAALPRQRLAELRALYTTHDTPAASARIDRAAPSPVFEVAPATTNTHAELIRGIWG